MFEFNVTKTDKDTAARCGLLKTSHGQVETPAFMPVATIAAVKTMSAEELRECSVDIMIANAYHLYLRPGDEYMRDVGGLHRFMGWDRPVVTDSGGFQIYSLSKLRKLSEEGAHFQSHIDGSRHFLTPESMVDVQTNLGSDIMMVLDQCADWDLPKDKVKQSVELTTTWASRSRKYFDALVDAGKDITGTLFGIVQGGIHTDLREKSLTELLDIGFDGYGIGGLSVGESREDRNSMVAFVKGLMPLEKCVHLMGVGKPLDILDAINEGIDLFDCVMPTRNGRNGQAFTSGGPVNLRAAKYRNDFGPIEEGCDCFACRNASRAYVRHLLKIEEILGIRFLTIHNISFYTRLLRQARQAIKEDKFSQFYKNFSMLYKESGED